MSAITGTRIDEVLQHAVESGTMPNVVATATNADGPIYGGAFGPKAVGKPDPVTVDTLFRIASMTKMVTTVAALQLVENGVLDLDEAVPKYRPEFADLKVLDGWDGDEPRLRDPKTFATVRQLVTHTSGLGYWFWNADLVRWEAKTGTANTLAGTADAFTAPLVADPGTKVEYGTNTDWLGLVVEAASGQKLDAYFDEHILGPLGMEQTTFHPTDQQRENLSAVHLRGEASGRVGGHQRGLERRARLVARRPRPVLPAERVPALPADAARQRHGRRHEDPRGQDGRGRVRQPDRQPRLARGDRHGRATDDGRLQRGPGLQVRPRPAAATPRT